MVEGCTLDLRIESMRIEIGEELTLQSDDHVMRDWASGLVETQGAQDEPTILGKRGRAQPEIPAFVHIDQFHAFPFFRSNPDVNPSARATQRLWSAGRIEAAGTRSYARIGRPPIG
jgi:hypothetical protein